MASQIVNPKLRADQERVSHLLTDTVTLLCKNGLQYKTEMKVQGLLGITLDNEVFLVQIDKKFGDLIGADMVKVHAEPNTNNSESGEDLSDTGSQSERKRHRRKRRRSSRSETSETATSEIKNVVIKAEAVEEDDDDDLVMMEPDSKMGLHDKDTMRESYGISYETEAHQIDNHTFQESMGASLEDQAGCSTWDDPLAALTDQNSSMAPHGGSSSGGDDTMDQQTMSTAAAFGRFCFDAKRGRAPYKYRCSAPGCTKRFNYKQNLQRHQTIKHGRVPTKPIRWDSLDDLPPVNIDLNLSSPQFPLAGIHSENQSVFPQIMMPNLDSVPTTTEASQETQDTTETPPEEMPPNPETVNVKVEKNLENKEESENVSFKDTQNSSHSLDALEKVANQFNQDTSTRGDAWEKYPTSLSYQQPSVGYGSGPGEYQCDRCDKSFNLKHNLRRHQTTKHGRAPTRVLGKSPVKTPFWE